MLALLLLSANAQTERLGPSTLTLARDRHLLEATSFGFRYEIAIADVAGIFRVTGREDIPHETFPNVDFPLDPDYFVNYDWKIEPVELWHTNVGTGPLTLWSDGPSVPSDSPVYKVGDLIYVHGTIRTDGRLVAFINHTLIRKPSGKATDGLGRYVRKLDGWGAFEVVPAGGPWSSEIVTKEDVITQSSSWETLTEHLRNLSQQADDLRIPATSTLPAAIPLERR